MPSDNPNTKIELPKTGKPLDAGTPDKDTESRLDTLTDDDSSGGMHTTKPGPGGEAPGQVSKM